MDLQIRPLHDLFGAEIMDGDLACCSRSTAEAIEEAIGIHGLLLFRNIAFADEEQARFAARFGPLQNMSGRPDTRAEILRISNVTEDGRIRPAEETSRRQHDANRLWHTDSSFLLPGATYSLLHARIVTAEGGHTEFYDSRAAWDALPADRQDMLVSRVADHSMLHSWRLAGVDMPGVTPARMPGVTRRLVPYHEPSGRRALMIPSHVERIDGFDYASAQALIEELTRIAAAPDRIYRHSWQVGDLLMWDNRCMLHRVTPYHPQEPRDLRSCRVLDLDDQGAIRQGAAQAGTI